MTNKNIDSIYTAPGWVRLGFRWLVNSLGLWMASRFFGGLGFDNSAQTLLIAGFILAIVNSVIRPFLIIASLPVILLTLGLFTLIVNGMTVYITHLFFSSFTISGFRPAILAGLTISVVNYLVTTIIESEK
jgi:putative membrane protein